MNCCSYNNDEVSRARNTYFPRRAEIIPPGKTYEQTDAYPFAVNVDMFSTVGGESFEKVHLFFLEHGDEYRRQTFDRADYPRFPEELAIEPIDCFLCEVRCPWSGEKWGVFRRVLDSTALRIENERDRFDCLTPPEFLAAPGFRQPDVPMSYSRYTMMADDDDS